VRAPFRAPKHVTLKAWCSQLRVLRQPRCNASKYSSQTHKEAGDVGCRVEVKLEACQDEAGNAANVLLLHEPQRGATVQ